MTEQLTRLGVGIDPSEAQRGAQAIIRELDAIRNRARTTVDAVDASFSKLRGTFFHLHTTLLNLKNDLNSKRFNLSGAIPAVPRTVGGAGGGVDSALTGSLNQLRTSIDQVDDGFHRLSLSVSALQKSIDGLHSGAGKTTGGTSVIGVPGMGGAVDGAKGVNKELESMGSRAVRVASSMDAAFSRLTATLFSMQTAMVGFAGGMMGRQFVEIVGGVESAMSGVEAVTKASKQEMADMTAVARELGAQTVFSARDAAEGMKFLGMAGFSTNEILKATPPMLYLAAAASMDLGRAADITSNIMTAFGIEAERAGEIADTLAVIAASANTDISQMGQAMKFAGPLAKGMGVSMQTAAAAIGVLSNAGLQAEMAGTGLRQVMITLAVPPKELKKAMDAAGVSMKDIDLRSHSLGEVLQTLKDAGIDAGEAMDIFGARGGTAASVLIDYVDQLAKMEAKLVDVKGAAYTMASVMTDNLPGAFSELQSAAEEFVLQLGDQGLSGGFRSVVEHVTGMINVWNGLADVLDQRIETFKSLAKAVEGVGTALGTILTGGGLIKLGQFLMKLGPAGVALGAAATGLGLLVAYRDDLWALVEPVEAANKAFEEQQKIILAQSDRLGILIPQFDKLASSTNRTVHEQEELERVIQKISSAIPQVADVLDRYTRGLISAADASRELQKEQARLKYSIPVSETEKELDGLRKFSDGLRQGMEEREALIKKQQRKLQQLPDRWEAQNALGMPFDLDNAKTLVKAELDRLQGIQDSTEAQLKQANERIKKLSQEYQDSVKVEKFAGETGIDPMDLAELQSAIVNAFTGIGAIPVDVEPKIKLPEPEPEDPSIRKKALKEMEDYTRQLLDLEFELQGERTLIGLEGVEARVQQENLERQRRVRELERSAREILNVSALTNDERLSLQEEFHRMEEGIIRNSDMRIAAIREDAFKKELEELEQKSKEKLEKAKREQEQLERLAEQYTFRFDPGSKYAAQQTEINDLFEQGLISADVKQRAVAAAQEELRRNNNDLLMSTREWQAGVTVAMDEYAFSAMDAAENFHRAWTNAISQTEDELVNFFMTGKLGFADLMQSITADLVRVAVRQNITGPLAQMIQGNAASMNPFADITGVGASIGNLFGGLFGGGRAKGGPIEAGKAYVVGEKGPELIMPDTDGTVIPNRIFEQVKFGGGRASGGSVSRDIAYITGELGPELFVPNGAAMVSGREIHETTVQNNETRINNRTVNQTVQKGGNDSQVDVGKIEINNYYQGGGQTRRDVVTPSRSKRQVMDDLAQMLSSRR